MSLIIASDIRTVRDAIDSALRSAGYKGALESLSVRELRSHPFQVLPQLLLVSSPSSGGTALIRNIRTSHPSLNVAVLGLNDGDEDFLAWAEIGISGFVEAGAKADAIAEAVLDMAAGQTVFPVRLSPLLLRHYARRRGATEMQTIIRSLTRREAETIELIADGLSNKQIARRLRITDATVKNHVHSILEKLNVASRGAAAALFRRVSPGDRPLLVGPPGDITPTPKRQSGAAMSFA